MDRERGDRAAEDAARDWPRLAWTILDSLGDGIYIVSPNRKVEFMNQALIRQFGDGRGRTCYEFFAGRQKPCTECRHLDVMKGQTARYQRTFDKTGKKYESSVSPIHRADGTILLMGIFRDITAHHEAEERALRRQEDYRQLFESVQQGIFVSTVEGRFQDCNPALLEMLGYDSKEELLGLDLARDIYVRAEDRKRFQAIMACDGSVRDFEVEFRRKDGSIITVMLAANALRDKHGVIIGYQGLSVDITERKSIERQLREKSEFLAKIIEASVDGIMTVNMTGHIIQYNTAAARILGYGAGEMNGRHISRIYPPGMDRRVMAMMRSKEHGGVGILDSLEVSHKRKDGSPVICEVSAAIIYGDDGEELASVGVLVDRTERAVMQERLAMTQRQLIHSEQMATMGRLTSQLAHEINNPLFGIINTLDLLRPVVDPESRRGKLLEMGISEAFRLAELVRKMLTLSRPDEQDRQECSFVGILTDLLLFVDKQMRERNIAVESDLPDGLPNVLVSANQMRQVFLNLFQNARDAMPKGGTLTVAARQRGANLEVTVADTGTGISKEHIQRVFHAFFTTKEEARGVGLGLTVCYGIVKEHDGEIEVDSVEGKGTTLTVKIPVSGLATQSA